MVLVPPFLRTGDVSGALGVSHVHVQKLCNTKELAAFRYGRFGHRRIERRSVVRWLRQRGLHQEELPSAIICDVVLVGLGDKIADSLRLALDSDDFRVLTRPVDGKKVKPVPRVLVVDLADEVLPPLHDVELSIGVAPADGVRARWRELGLTKIVKAPVSGSSLATMLQSLVG